MTDFTKDIDHCVKTMHSSGLILYPTDTIWGIGCDATNVAAVQKIFSLKRRAETKSMIILVADEDQVKQYAQVPPAAIRKMIREYDNPLTVIYPSAKNIAKNLINIDGTIAMRIVKDSFCIELITAFGKPVVSTSANISGEPFPNSFAGISSQIKAGADYIARHRQNDDSPSNPSRIITWTEREGLKIIRE